MSFVIPYFQIDFHDESLLDKVFLSLETNHIACINWNDFTYAPQVSFKIFHTGKAIAIRYEVREDVTKAEVEEDNGEVWTDSCCEFFIRFENSHFYYNLETTCIGRALLGYRESREKAEHASQSVMKSIYRKANLGSECFSEKRCDRWTLDIVIPVSALFKSNIETLCNQKASMNLYKCGDSLSKPHYLSWNPIDTPRPDFHRPEFFRETLFSQEVTHLENQ